MFDEEGRKIKIQEFPRKFDNMSIEEIQDYIVELKNEIIRAEQETAKKKASRDAAASIFKS